MRLIFPLRLRHRSTARILTVSALAAVLCGARALPASAQATRADALLSSGRVGSAESLFYAQAATDPRDPIARLALGRYLASRGALKVGAVLMEEARFFGGDPRTVARELAPVYRALGDWRALATLPASPLSPAERAQAVWMVTHQPTLQMPDSAKVSYAAARDSNSLGTIALRIGRRTIDAQIDPGVNGIVLPAEMAQDRGIKSFGSETGGVRLAVISSVGIGTVALENVPAQLQRGENSEQARLGLDVLLRLAPSFDARAGLLTLRRSGRVEASFVGERLPTLRTRHGMEVAWRDALHPITASELRPLLSDVTWTLDPARGDLIVSR